MAASCASRPAPELDVATEILLKVLSGMRLQMAQTFQKITLQYEYFVSISCLRLMVTNSLCTPPVLRRPSRSWLDQKREKVSF